jgi:hypothetical protein
MILVAGTGATRRARKYFFFPKMKETSAKEIFFGGIYF